MWLSRAQARGVVVDVRHVLAHVSVVGLGPGARFAVELPSDHADLAVIAGDHVDGRRAQNVDERHVPAHVCVVGLGAGARFAVELSAR